jgi:uncharacterized membrane protein YfcA
VAEVYWAFPGLFGEFPGVFADESVRELMPDLPLPDFYPYQWVLAVLGAMCIGFSKSGFAGIGLIHIIIFAHLFGARESTGALLPMLIIGDVCAVFFFRQYAQWNYIRRILPPALIGVVAAWAVMHKLDETMSQRLMGGIILLLALLQMTRMWRPQWFTHIPHAWWFAWSLGLLAGCTTMLANGAGPIVAIYLLAVGLPKSEFVGTGAWFFLIINVYKVPFSSTLGLIRPDTLTLNVLLAPAILAGMLLGRQLVHRISQRRFDYVLLTLAVIGALRLMGVDKLLTRFMD